MPFGLIKRRFGIERACACGCGLLLPKTVYHGKMREKYGKYPRFIVGHATRDPKIKLLIKGRPDVIKQWLIDNEGKFKCQCGGCDRTIKLQRDYHSKGVPQYAHGHHPNSSKSSAQLELGINTIRRKFLMADRVDALVRYDYLCAVCGWGGKDNVKYFEFDHIVPIAKGGLTCADNCQPLCRTCHKAKTKQDNKERTTHVVGQGFRGA